MERSTRVLVVMAVLPLQDSSGGGLGAGRRGGERSGERRSRHRTVKKLKKIGRRLVSPSSGRECTRERECESKRLTESLREQACGW